MKPKIVAISGSTKSVSTSQSIINHVKLKYADSVDLHIFDGISNLPHFNPELEADLPDEVDKFRSLLQDANGVLFVTPEYVFSLPGSLKNAIEWLVSTDILSGKPAATIIAAASGLKAFESLNLILRTIETILPESSTGLIQGAKGKVSSEGKIVDETTIEKIDKIVISLLDCFHDENKQPSKYQ